MALGSNGAGPEQHVSTKPHTTPDESSVIEIAGEVLELPESDRDHAIISRCGRGELADRVRAVVRAGCSLGEFMERSPVRIDAGDDECSRGGLPSGTAVGGYRLVKLIGSGSMGDVYEAESGGGVPVAVKVVRPGAITRELRRRFEFEVLTLARLRHDNIARLLDSGTFEGQEGVRPYFVMELVQGRAITDHVRDRTKSASERLDLFLKVCDAVAHAHRMGVIHRDLKPANILVDETRGEPKVLDFGIARAIDPEGTLSTSPGEHLIGSAPYMSPEQVNGTEVDTRADIYGLGTILFELLSERRAIDTSGRSLPDVLRAIRDETPPRLRATDASLPGDIEIIVATAMAKDPHRRYQSAAALAEDLRRLRAGEPLLVRRPRSWYLIATLIRRHRVLLACAVAILLVMGIAIALGSHQMLRAQAAERRSEDLLMELVQGSRSLVVDLNDRLRRERQPLEARRATLEAALAYLSGVRDRAGSDPRVLEELAATYLRLGEVVGGGSESSLGQTDAAIDLFSISRGIYADLLAAGDTDTRRLGLAAAIERLALTRPNPHIATQMREAAHHVSAVAARATGHDATEYELRSLRLRLIAATETGDVAELRQVIASFAVHCHATQTSFERWGELGLAQKYLAELLVERDPPEALRAALACQESLARSIALGSDGFSNNRHLAMNDLVIVKLSAGVRPAEELLELGVQAITRSRGFVTAAPSDNFVRVTHMQCVYSFVERGVELASATPPPGQTLTQSEIAVRVAGLVREELETLESFRPTIPSPHPIELVVLREIERSLEELKGIAGPE